MENKWDMLSENSEQFGIPDDTMDALFWLVRGQKDALPNFQAPQAGRDGVCKLK